MLAAAAAGADAGGLAHDFREQAFHVAVPREVMPVAAVIAENPVAILEMFRNGQRGELLPDAGVDRAMQPALGEEGQQLFLKMPDEDGLSEQFFIHAPANGSAESPCSVSGKSR